jgi:hypothetical protein
VYSGLVPMSPNTTPTAPITKGQVRGAGAPSWVEVVMVLPEGEWEWG